MQKVYLPVQRVLSYRVSLYAKHVSGPSGLTVLFRDRGDRERRWPQSRVDAPASEWTKYETTLELSPGSVRRLQAVDFGCCRRRSRDARMWMRFR